MTRKAAAMDCRRFFLLGEQSAVHSTLAVGILCEQ